MVENGAPRIEPNQTPYVMTLSARADNVIRRRRALGAVNDAGTTLERIEMNAHTGTHIDALGHATIGDRMYNGRSAAAVLDDFGLRELGVEHVPPIVTRGICLDVAGEPGIEEGAARWLTARGVVAIAADNMAVEVVPNPRHPEVVLPVHQHTLVEAGVYLVENLKLDELAASGRREFCFVLLATKLRGATGCPVRPVAMF